MAADGQTGTIAFAPQGNIPDWSGIPMPLHRPQPLRDQGYQLNSPQATFYLLPQTPIADDRAFCALLAEQGVAVLPGHVIDLPGYFRLCLTATDEAIERSLPIFAHAIQHANSHLRS